MKKIIKKFKDIFFEGATKYSAPPVPENIDWKSAVIKHLKNEVADLEDKISELEDENSELRFELDELTRRD